MQSQFRSYLELHISVLLWGFTAVLGKIIKISAVDLVWWRCFITAISMLFLIRPLGRIFSLDRKVVLKFICIGMIFGLHWLTFFGSIKLSSASVTLVCMSTCAFFASLTEPFLMKTPFSKYNTLIGILIIPGMYLIFQSTQPSMHLGIWVGLLSSFLAAITVSLNKKSISELDALSITFLEMLGALVVIGLIQLVYNQSFFSFPDGEDLAVLVFLALACTTMTWILVLRALKSISAFSISLAVNLEAVYGIILSCLLLKDYQLLNRNFFIGATMVILLVFTYPFINRITSEKEPAL